MKAWEKVIDMRLGKETTMGEEQFGVMPGEGLRGEADDWKAQAEWTTPGVHRPGEGLW